MMTKGIITEQQIREAVKKLVANGYNPTLSAVRKRLGCRGSLSTIHKYLLKWKQECFKNVSSLNKVVVDNSDLLEEHRILKLELQKQFNQNEYYAQELINAEKANIALNEEKHQLQTANQELKLRLTTAETANKALGQVTQEITNRLDANDKKNVSNQQQIIKDLREELKTVNETSLIALRETSTKGHEALMQEKVNSINLQTKVDSLYKELIDLKKQLGDTVLKHQIQTQTLLRQINEQQKIIQDHIGFEKLRELVGEEVMLHFNNKPGVAYGK